VSEPAGSDFAPREAAELQRYSTTRGGTGAHFSFTDFFLMHKGDLTLAFSFFVYLVSLAALMFTHWRTSSETAVSMAEAALIGGLCDYIALKMIFERRWRRYGDDPRTYANRAEREIGRFARIARREAFSGSALDRKSRAHARIWINSLRCPHTRRLECGAEGI
jgi:hypothetical protein